MLGKLLKYDLRYVYKTLGVYYVITIVTVVCGTLLLKIHNPPFIISFIGEILASGGIGLSIGLVINAFTRTWMRFRKNLYGDESYLTHTLPISRLHLFTSKFVSSVIILLLSLIIVAIVLLIYVPEASSSVFSPDIFNVIPDTSITIFYCAIVFILLLIMQSIFVIMCGFTGTIINRNFSLIIGTGCYLVVSVILIGIIFILSSFDPELNALIARGHQPSLPTVINCSWICIAVYTTVTAIMFAMNVKLLNRGVNVE